MSDMLIPGDIVSIGKVFKDCATTLVDVVSLFRVLEECVKTLADMVSLGKVHVEVLTRNTGFLAGSQTVCVYPAGDCTCM